MRVKRIPIIFEINESERPNITLDANSRLNPQTHAIELKPDSNGAIPTAPDITVRSRLYNPQSVKRFIGFDVDLINVYDPDLGADVTGANYRLNDGTQDLYWDGAAWSPAGASDWNTEAEVADNISSFPVVSAQIQVVLNPFTVDGGATPRITEVRILMESDLEELEDIVWRSLLRKLKSDIRPITDHPITLQAAGATIDLNTYPLEAPYNIADVDSVFNWDTDPKGQIDLLSSYNPTTKIITLSGPLAAGTRVWIKVVYEPEVAVTTSQEYDELAKVPAIIFRDINVVDSAEMPGRCAVKNKNQGTAVVIQPRMCDITLLIEAATEKQKDLQRLSNELVRFFGKNPLLRSTGLDRDYRLWLIDDYDGTTVASQSELHTGRFRARIVKALFFDRPAEDLYTVEQFHMTGLMDTVVN